jgi:hypothetical protein
VLVIQHRLALKENTPKALFTTAAMLQRSLRPGRLGIRHLFALPAKRLYESLKDSLSHASG